MSSSRSSLSLTGRRVWCASSAAMHANGAAWVSLPPKPPPMRRTSTVIAWCGLSSTLAIRCCTSLGCWVELHTSMSPSSPGTAKRDLALQIEMVLAAHPDAARRGDAARWRSPARGRRGASRAAAARRTAWASASSIAQDRLELAVFDLGQARGAARLLDRRRGDREQGLTGIFDRAVGEQRIARIHRADVVHAGHVLRRHHRDHARAPRAPASRSMRTISACACVLRPTAACSMPAGSGRSST